MTKKEVNLVYNKDKIIILQVQRYLESNLIVKGLNYNGHILSLFARSALKSRKRFPGGMLEPGRYLQIEYTIPSRSEGWSQLHSASIIRSFDKIRADYDRLQLCLNTLKMVNRIGETGIRGEKELFNLLGNFLISLETTQNLNRLKLFFEIRFLFLQGVLPLSLQNKHVFFESTIKNHLEVDLSSENLPDIQRTLNEALNQYLSI